MLPQVLIPPLGPVQLLLFVGNQNTVGQNLLIQVPDSGGQQVHLLVQHLLSGHQLPDFIPVPLIFRLYLGNLRFNFLLLLLKGLNLFPDFRRGCRPGGNRNPRQQKGGNQNPGRCLSPSHFVPSRGNRMKHIQSWPN